MRHSLPAIALQPGETRAVLTAPSGLRYDVASEYPEIVEVWTPLNAAGQRSMRALRSGETIVHILSHPIPVLNPSLDPFARTSWRERLRREIHPSPDEPEFHDLTDFELWQRGVRTNSLGATRVVVEREQVEFR